MVDTNRPTQREQLRAHLSVEYPDLSLTDTQLDNYLDAQERITGATERREEIGEIEVYEVTSDQLDDLVGFFDNDAFADNLGWAACYCTYHHLPEEADPPWEERSWQQNRASLADRIRTGATKGFLAYVDGQPAGWLNASPRAEVPHHATGSDEGISSLVCFIVAPPYRRHGVAVRLLEAALEELAANGAREAEAYPIIEPKSVSAAYRGDVSTLERFGFEITDNGDGTATARRELKTDD